MDLHLRKVAARRLHEGPETVECAAGVDRLRGERHAVDDGVGLPRDANPRGRVREDHVPLGTHLAVQDPQRLPRGSRGVRPREVLRADGLESQVPRHERVVPRRPVRDLAHRGRAAEADLVDAGETVDDDRPLHAQAHRDVGNDLHELGREHAEDVTLRPRGVRQRAEDVEHRAHADLLPRPCGMAHRGMELRGEHEAEARLPQDPLDLGRLEVHAHAERLEEIRTPARARPRAVPVLRDDDARPGDGEHRDRGDVERVEGRASRAAQVHHAPVRGASDRRAALAHRDGHPRDLLRGLSLHPQADEQRPDLSGRRMAVHDLRHRVVRALERQGSARDDVGEDLADHRRTPFRKFFRIAGPSGVRIDSGWNWRPSIGYVRWRTAMISPSSAVALTSSAEGTLDDSIARLWYRPATIGFGRPSNTVRPSCRTRLVLPWRSRAACPTVPPNAVPTPWWPRQTPRVDVHGLSSRRISAHTPKSRGFAGCPGPGDSTIASGSMPRTSLRVIASFLTTTGCAPSSPSRWYRLYTKES